MGLLALHGYLTPAQPPERALQEQIAERALALHVIICIPCPHNHRYSGSRDACVLSLRYAGLCFGGKRDQHPRPAPARHHAPATAHAASWTDLLGL